MRELRWKQPRTERLLARLGPIPHAHGLKPVFGVVRVSDYVDLLEHPTEQVLVGGYLCALHPVIRQVLLAFPGTERIKWIFEEQEQYEPLVRLVFANYELLNCKERCAGVEFVPKDSTSLTQPSDYLVYAQLQRMRDESSQKSKWCAPILQNLPSQEDSIIGRELIRYIVKQALYWAIVKTGAETGKGIEDIRKGHETRSKILESARKMQASPSPVSSNLPSPREPEPKSSSLGPPNMVFEALCHRSNFGPNSGASSFRAAISAISIRADSSSCCCRRSTCSNSVAIKSRVSSSIGVIIMGMKHESKAEKKPEPFTWSDFHALLRRAANPPSKQPAPAKKQT